MPQATVKSYDSITRTGSLLADDGTTEYAVDEDSLENSMFRFLRPGQRVTFDLVEGQVRALRIGIA